METIEVRASQHDFVACPDYENLPTIFARVRQLLTTGRSFTMIDYFITGDPDPNIRVASGLRLDEVDGQRRWQEDAGRRTRGFSFNFTRVRGFGLFVDDKLTEAELMRRFHEKKPATLIRINGRGSGVDDYIEARTWNEHGVQGVIRIQLEDREHATE